MADISRTITLEEEQTVFLAAYGTNSTDTNLTFVIDGIEQNDPLVFSPGQALGTQMILYGCITLAAGEHTVALRGVFADITQGWIHVMIGETTGQTTIGIEVD